jgi:anti-sigma B factor antagonist
VEFDVKITSETPLAWVTVAGEVDVYTADALREALREAEADSKQIIVDLLEVNFLDSTGIGVLVGSLKRLREGGGDLHLVVTQPSVLKVLRITSLDRVFQVHADLDEARSAAEAGASGADKASR